MKNLIHFISSVVLISLALSACNLPAGAPTQAATEPPSATEVSATEAAQPLVTVTGEAPPTLVAIDLAGPPMEVGSKYRYVDGTELVAVPGGEFTMGYNSADNPVHQVTLSDFWIYSTKVTNQQYALCVNAGKCAPPDPKNNPVFGDIDHINFPVTGVNYEQSAAYCTFVHGRLPTEAEWEKTARGPDGNLFPWGDKGPVCNLLNFKSCLGRTSKVNDYPDGISYYSAFDMSGNAREWVADWYSPSYYSEAPSTDPLGPVLGEKRSVRGSSFQDGADPAISAHRFSLLPAENLPDLGFRCVIGDPTYFAPFCEQQTYIGQGPNGEPADCTPNIQCNSVDIKLSANCTGKPDYTAYTIVTFTLSNTPPDAWSYDVPGCTSPVAGASNKFQCIQPGSFTASAQGSCVDTASCTPSCPAHYKKSGDSCVWDGSLTGGSACLPGATYDPAAMCCTFTTGTATSYNFCPAGYTSMKGVCISDVKYSPDNKLQAVYFDDKCAPPDKQTTCQEPSRNYCIQYKATWNSKKCCCVNSDNTCVAR